jgi:hypothetical protein
MDAGGAKRKRRMVGGADNRARGKEMTEGWSAAAAKGATPGAESL